MSLAFAVSALTAALSGFVLRWYVTRSWERLYVDPATLVLPMICPVCLLGNPTALVKEESRSRQTGYYVIAAKIEWTSVKVPHCERCRNRIERSYLLALILSALTIMGAWLLFWPSKLELRFFLVSILFGFPAFLAFPATGKGIMFGKAYPGSMLVLIRHKEYRDALCRALSRPADTPLGDNKGVWVHR